MGVCELCNREKELSFHHLIPKTLHSKNYFKKKYKRQFMVSHGLYLCHECHRNIHIFFSEKELGKYYFTKNKLLETDKIKNFLNWVKKQK